MKKQELYAIITSMRTTYVIATDLNKARDIFNKYSKDYADKYRIVNEIKIVATTTDYEAKENVSLLLHEDIISQA